MIFPRIVGTFVPRYYIYCCGYIDGKRNNAYLSKTNSKNIELFYFKKKTYDYHRFASRCFFKLNKKTTKYRSKITRRIKIYNSLKNKLDELNKIDLEKLTLRENRKKTAEIKSIEAKLNSNANKMIKKIESYNTKVLKMYNHIHKNENKLNALFTQYIKGLNSSNKQTTLDIVYPELKFEDAASYIEFSSQYKLFHEEIKKISEVFLDEKNNQKAKNKEEAE
jgi:hypothetical protein